MLEQLKINYFEFFDPERIEGVQSDSLYLEFLIKLSFLYEAHHRILNKLLNGIESEIYFLNLDLRLNLINSNLKKFSL